LHVANKRTPFTVADVQACEEITPRVAVSVETTRMLLRSRMQQQIERALSEAAVTIASGTSTQASLIAALQELRILFRSSFMAMVGADAEPIIASDPTVLPAQRQRLLAAARSVEGELADVTPPVGAGDPGSATLHVPVRLGPDHLGTLAVFRNHGEAFTVDERRGVLQIAHLIALSWASERYQQQRAALARLQERQRIADDLHDDVAQILFAAQMQLDTMLESDLLEPAARVKATHARGLLIRADTSIRNVIAQLAKPDATALGDRLAETVDSVEEEFMVSIHLDISGSAAETADGVRRPIADTVVKVAREALVNAAKHAGPCRISATLDCTPVDRLRLKIADDGIGIAEHGHDHLSHGIASLRRSVRRHGGTLRVRQSNAGGTVVLVNLPR
jgi:signal transduction histidine kinase